MWTLKRKDTNELIYKIETDSQTQRMNAWLPGGRMEGRSSWGVWDGQVYTATFKMDNQQGATVQQSELRSELPGSLNGRGVQENGYTQPGWERSAGEWVHAAWMGEECRRMGTRGLDGRGVQENVYTVHMLESLCCQPETITFLIC